MTVGTTTHIALGGHEYIIKPYSYSKRSAPQFGARFTSGDPDYNNLSFWQHWAQKCFIGGMDAEEFSDESMYDEGVGVNTWEHDKVTLARDLRRGLTGGVDWTMAAGTNNGNKGARMIVYNNQLYWLGLATLTNRSYLYRWDPSTDGWVRITALDGRDLCARSIATFDGKLFIGGISITGTTRLVYSSGSLGTWTTVSNPSGVSQGVYALRAFQRKLYVAYGTQVWRLKEDLTWDGNTVFYKADQNSDSNYIRSMETHLGFLYMLSLNGHVHRSDGNSTFDIWSWDGQTTAEAIRSFDGRLFIATNEYSDPANPTAAYGVLYQMSGSAVTELKRWGKTGEFTGLGSLTVYSGKLFYGASNLLGMRAGFGVAMYDPVEDAHSVFASNGDTVTYNRGSAPYVNYSVDEVIAFGNRLFVSVRGSGAFYVKFAFRDRIRINADWDTSTAGVNPGPQNGGWFTTSTYDAGMAGTKKLWRRVLIDYELPHSSTSLTVEVSYDNGATWTAFTSLTTVTSVARTTVSLAFASSPKSTSIKLRFTLRSTNSIYTPIFYGFSVSYIPVPDPNWQWTFTIVLTQATERADQTGTITTDTEGEIAFLSSLFRFKELVAFTDIDGTQWASGGQGGVLIQDIDFRIPFQTQPLEGEVVVTLLEAVESF